MSEEDHKPETNGHGAPARHKALHRVDHHPASHPTAAGHKAPAATEDHKDDRVAISIPRKRLMVAAAALGGAALLLLGVLYWLHARRFEDTDDAFVDGNQSQVASQVSGRIDAILIADNQHVASGDPLLTIDPRDYQVRLAQSRAATVNAEAEARQARADLALQQADLQEKMAQVRVAEADLLKAEQDLARYRGIDPAAVTRLQLNQVEATDKSAAAKLDSARQSVVGAEAQLKSQQAKIEAADASVVKASADVLNAELQLSYTRIVAPQAGRVTRRSVNLGNYVTPGQALLAIVPDDVWVTANFKETQLNFMKPGEPVEIRVDAFPKARLRAHVDSFQHGTGSVFSSIPAENATGNYVKVVQRIPVKIVFDNDDWRGVGLAQGMSVTPVVQVR
jgi:membrane fusion protein (multidrug efflux system)